MVKKVLNYEVDIGMIEGEVKHRDLELIPWLEDELVVFCAADHPLMPATYRLTFDVVATDPDGDRISLVASAVVSVGEWRLGIRAGEVGVDSASGTVTFTPNANDTPQRTLVITAEDPSGEKSSIDVLVLVSTGAPRGAESRE